MYTYQKIFSIVIILLCFGCDQKQSNINEQDKKKQYQSYTVTTSKISNDIEQTGVIRPLTHDILVSPVTGFITSQNLPYGADAEKGEDLFVISDTELSAEVFSKLTNYHSAKWDYESNKNKYLDFKLQFASGLVAYEEVKQKEIEADRSEMKLIQSEFELKRISNKINKNLDDLKKLNLDELKKTFLYGDQKDSIIITSPNNGTLIPLGNKINDKDTIAKTGTKVEGGQAFAALANLNRGEIQIELDENQVNNVKNGMDIIVKSLSKNELQLTGKIKTIKLFEFSQKSDNMTRYPVNIAVESKTNIKPGTRCKIIVPMPSRTAIMIPIKAVNDTYKSPYVLMSNGSKRSVTLGKTNINQVEITKGLSPNETILVPSDNHTTS